MRNSTVWTLCTVLVCVFWIGAILTIRSSVAGPTVDTELDKSMETMHAEMEKVRYIGNADADFALVMIPHHRGAIEMAKVEIQFGTDSRLRRLAQEMIITQQSEIKVMEGAIGSFPLSSLSLKRKNWCAR